MRHPWCVERDSLNINSKNQYTWWRRGESEYSDVLKTHKLLKNRSAQKIKNAKIAPNWNVSGTWDFHPSRNKGAVDGGEIRTPEPLRRSRSTRVRQIFQLSDVVSNPSTRSTVEPRASVSHIPSPVRVVSDYAHGSEPKSFRCSFYDFVFCFLPWLPLFPVHRCIAVFLLSNCSCFSMPFASK